jgi:hypothetical protein
MKSENIIPEDLREQYARAESVLEFGQCSDPTRFQKELMLIERIATLTGERDRQYEFNAGAIAKIAALEEVCDSLEAKLGQSYAENVALEAQVAALSKPVSDEEYYRVCTEGARTTRGLWNINRIIAARLQPAPEETNP